MVLFHLLKIDVLDLLVVAVVGAALRALGAGLLVEAAVEVCAGLLGTALLVHLGGSGLPSALQFGSGGIDGGDVLVVVGGLQLGPSFPLLVSLAEELQVDLAELVGDRDVRRY